MYINISTSNSYPKTLTIRNSEEKEIWQVYHVQKESEASKLAANATKNGFDYVTLEDYQPEQEETWPNWRETCNKSLLE